MLISGLAPLCSVSTGTLFGGAAPCLLKSAYMWGRDWDQERPCTHGQQVRKETRMLSPGPGIEVDMNPLNMLRVGWGREDIACRASSHGEALGKFIHVFYTHDWGTVGSMGVILYPGKCKYKYVFTPFHQTTSSFLHGKTWIEPHKTPAIPFPSLYQKVVPVRRGNCVS